MQRDRELTRQYANSSNLMSRASLHQRFAVSKYGWGAWVFDQFDLPDSCCILEVGCGNAALWSANRDRVPTGWHVTLTDASPGMVAEAQQALRDTPIHANFAPADAAELPFPDRTSDAVVANHMLYHVADLDAALAEIARVLRPGGTLYATTNGHGHMGELRELVRPIIPDLPFVTSDTTHAFGLETGRDKLARHFVNATCRLYDDALHVTEPQPLIDYVMSVRGAAAIDEQNRQRIEQAVHDHFKQHGAMNITKSQGMFVAQPSEVEA